MPVVAFITRTFASRTFFSQSPNNVGADGGVGYTLRKADGTNLGSFQDVAAAQATFRRLFGPSRILKWERRDLRGDVEQHVAIALPLDPREIWGDQLALWTEPALVPGSVTLQTVSAGTIRKIADLSGDGNNAEQTTLVDQPTLIGSDSDFNGRAAINFDGAAVQFFDVPSTAPTAGFIGVPFTVIVVANLASAGVDRALVFMSGATLFRFGSNVAGVWEVDNGAGPSITGPAVSAASSDIATFRQTAAGGTLRVNSVVVGSNALLPSAETLTISDPGVPSWDGRVSLIVIARNGDLDNTKILQTERYARFRYQ